jgi:RuvB-like protein 1
MSNAIAAHTHVRGLGLGLDGYCVNDNACGLIGQHKAREACGLLVDIVQAQQLAGRAVLLVGPPGTGKTAIALALSKELGKTGGNSSIPFCQMTASQVYSAEIGKTAVLQQHFRRAIAVRIREQKEVYEGVVTQLTVEETADATGSTYGRTISHVILGLKTTKGSKTLKLDPTLYDALTKEKVTVGDVIYIESNSGAVKRVGRSDAYATEFDLEAEDYVPIPKGDVHKKRAVVQDVTLHDLDVANAHPSTGGAGNDIMTMMASLGNRRKKTEITDKLRQEINKVVTKYVQDGIAELIPGVLFMDEAHLLDLECFTFLHKALESNLSPIVVLATNRGITTVRGSQIKAPHGIPIDLLDRLLIVPTYPYSESEMQQILALRAKTEGLTLDEAALQALAAIGKRSSSLRYASQLLSSAAVLAETSGRPQTIQSSDIKAVDALFLDSKASARKLQMQRADQGQHHAAYMNEYMT